MIPENLKQARRLFWLGRTLLALSAILLPVVAYGVAVALVDGHAQKEYFEAVSQILPVLLPALAIEQRYFTRRRPFLDCRPQEHRRLPCCGLYRPDRLCPGGH